MPDENFKLYSDPEHQPFVRHGMGRGAVLLVHGFPGTPAEMRPMARSLHQSGWTVRGPLLPGFGGEIAELQRYGYRQWGEALRTARQELARRGEPVVLFGYSMGAALTIMEAAENPPAALVLAAPFHRLGSRAQNLIWPMLNLLMRRFRPYERANFSDPGVRAKIASSFPGVDLGDPAVVANLRRVAIPFSALSQLRQAGRTALRSAPRVTAPVLVLQGQKDEVVTPENTERLIDALGGPVEVIRVQAGHDLLEPKLAAWPEIESGVLDFLSRNVHPARVDQGGT